MSFYTPVQEQRLFRPGKFYCEIPWNDFRAVVAEFKGRIESWYIQPAKCLSENGDFAFSVMATNCLLIDTLSQYYYGNDPSPTERKYGQNGSLESSGAKFKDFVVERLKCRTGILPTPIGQPVTTKNRKGNPLLTFEDVLWSGFRCGILHQAHVPLYGMVGAVDNVIKFQSIGPTKYADGKDCPTVICFPQELLQELETVFIKYIEDLQNADHAFDELRRRFKAKFEDSFGVPINITL